MGELTNTIEKKKDKFLYELYRDSLAKAKGNKQMDSALYSVFLKDFIVAPPEVDLEAFLMDLVELGYLTYESDRLVITTAGSLFIKEGGFTAQKEKANLDTDIKRETLKQLKRGKWALIVSIVAITISLLAVLISAITLLHNWQKP